MAIRDTMPGTVGAGNRPILKDLEVAAAGTRLAQAGGREVSVQVLAEVAAVVSGVALGVASGRLVLEGILSVMFGRRS